MIELPVPALAATYERRILTLNGRSFPTDCYELDGHVVWGATARILADLLGRIERIGLDLGRPCPATPRAPTS